MNMRKWTLGAVAGLLLGTMASLGAQNGPYSSQIQRALANFTGQLTVTFTGSTLTAAGVIQGTGGVYTGATGAYHWVGRDYLVSGADGLFVIENNGATIGAQFSTGTAIPTVTTCGTGAVTAHSTNMAGEVTPTGATACTVTFGAPNFTNRPFCTLTVEAATLTAYISAVSVSAFTVTGLASGEPFFYECVGGI
jgi:hypothetical protein